MSNDKSKHSAKKAAVLKNSGSKINPMVILVVAAVVIAAGALSYYITGAGKSGPNQVNAAPSDTGDVSYPVSMFADGKARHFDYHAQGMNIRYFVLKSSDGVLRAAFDACDVCWPAGKGYYQEGDEMICRNCGRRFASKLVNEVKGGCNPAPLNRKVEGDNLIIKAEDILRGKTYFNFKAKG